MLALPSDLAHMLTLPEHCQKSKIEYPVYTESSIHPSRGPFSCAVQVVDGPPSGFGSTAGHFKNKSDAKKNAAMEAVLWFRHQDQLAVEPSAKETSSETETGLSRGKQAQDLCLRLGFTSPAFELVPQPGGASFYNVHAIFQPQDVRFEPKLAGSVAPVWNVFGKKAAKDECWRRLLTVLEEISQSRGGAD